MLIKKNYNFNKKYNLYNSHLKEQQALKIKNNTTIVTILLLKCISMNYLTY